MRFVLPEVVKLDLPNGDWIKVKKELTVEEDHAYRTAGMVAKMDRNGRPDVSVDFNVVARCRVKTYLLDWSAKDAEGKDIAVTPSAVDALATEDFELIDAAILEHIAALAAEKKRLTLGSATGSPS